MMDSNLMTRHYGIGAVIYGMVSLLWLAWEFAFGTVNSFLIVGFAIAAVAILIFFAVRMITGTAQPVGNSNPRAGMWFGIIFAWEGIGIGVASGVLIALGMAQWIPVAVVIVVGLHFFPLGRLLNISTDYVIGAILVLLGVLTPLFVANPEQWVSIIAYGAAMTLYVAGCLRLLVGQQFQYRHALQS